MCQEHHCFYCKQPAPTEQLFGHYICDACLELWQASQETEMSKGELEL